MSNSQPELKTEKKQKQETKLTDKLKSKAQWGKLVNKVKSFGPKIKVALKKLTPKKREKNTSDDTPPQKRYRSRKQEEASTEQARLKRQKESQQEELSSEKLTRKQQKKKQKAEKKKNKKPKRRVFPIWLRIIVVLLLCSLAVVAGAVVGYGIIGSGKPSDALDMETWRHIFDIVTEKK
ncbi:DNA-directed RNA polymerase subunit beta [Virgibacillus sp. DJP39]|uniref:DNA-directed RNA polymerase subunit beta n=1 Tax=Virgibacillus sp. DJP39 TaxID=3409790 RepID=UPI003BB5CDD8